MDERTVRSMAEYDARIGTDLPRRGNGMNRTLSELTFASIIFMLGARSATVVSSASFKTTLCRGRFAAWHRLATFPFSVLFWARLLAILSFSIRVS